MNDGVNDDVRARLLGLLGDEFRSGGLDLDMAHARFDAQMYAGLGS